MVNLGKFKGINHLRYVYINEKQENSIEYKYYFNQTDNNVELIFDDDLDDCECMFYECINITEINLSNFDTSNVKDMNHMFYQCTSLTSIDLSNFNTSQVTNMWCMFAYCSSLISLDLSNFETSNVENMVYLFANCLSLTSLNLSNFNTLKVTTMSSMFYSCSSLTSLDLSNFNTSNVEYMGYMFYNCSSLTSLNLSNFDTSKVTNINQMFFKCINLEYINLYKFNEIKLSACTEIFVDVPENIVICIDENNIKNNVLPQISKIKCKTISCSKDWKSIQKKIINDTNECIDSCENSTQYKYEYNGKCYENCSNGFLYDNNDNKLNKCKCELDQCLTCPNVALNKNLCTKCNINYYPKEDDILNLGKYINCYNEIEDGYYLDIEDGIYKKCYESCKTCYTNGDNKIHNCLECNENFPFKIEKNNYYNCFENCSYYYYFDNENNYHCTINSSCPKEYSQLLENKKECIKYDIEDVIKKFLSDIEVNQTEKSKEKEIQYYDNILKFIENEFTSENYIISKLNNEKEDFIKAEKMTIILAAYESQLNNMNNNITRIELDNCVALLRNYYNISINESLYIKKVDIIQDEMKTLKVEYDLYANLFGNKLINLNLSVCRKSKISIYIPITLSDNIDKYNISSGYYNDICYTTTTEDGTDILLKDRQKEYIDKDYIVCQEDCDFSEYDYDNFVAKCSCEIKDCDESFADMSINKNKLLDNFKNIKNFMNFKFLICYKKLFNKEGILNNIGFYIIFLIILFHIITILIFSIKKFSSLKKKIKDIAYKKKLIKKISFGAKKDYENKNDNNQQVNNMHHISHMKTYNDSGMNIGLEYKNNKSDNNKYIDEEINGFSFDLAIKYDKRTFCLYYVSLIKTQHSLICAFFNNNDYNLGIIKINLFFIGFTIEYAINALFYNDDTMHKIYESKGDFDLETQLPIAIYSTIISMILNYPLNFLALSNDAIINFKQDNTKINLLKKLKELIKILTIKFTLYFIISFLFLIFFWYYISMFGVIYRNTQLNLLKDTLISIGLSLFIPFLYYLLPGLFRITALSNKHKKRECLYNFSKFFQLF